MKRPALVLLPPGVLVLVLSYANELRAQVNTEPLRKRVKRAGYSFVIEGTLTGDTGNTEGIQAGGGVGGGWANATHLVFAYARADYSRFNGITQVSKSFAHARYNAEIAEWVWGEAFVQAQSNEFERLKLRDLVGAGPRFRLLHADSFDVYFGTAYMLERDIIDVAPGAGDVRDYVRARSSNYLTAHWDVDARASLATTMYVQPALSEFSDVRLLSETLLTFKVTKVLAASVSGTVHYDSVPPTGVKSTDAEIKNALSVTF